MKKIILIISLSITILFACDSSNDGPSGDGFNRIELVTNLADNIIIPAYQDLDAKLTNLVSQLNTFTTTPNTVNLESFRTAWIQSYTVWQSVEMFNIGKADELQYHFKMNVYPVNVTDIINNISTQTYDLDHPNNNDAIGFPALDYLLYGAGTNDSEILEKYTTNVNAIKYKTYLTDVVEHMKLLTETILNDWNTTYRDHFVSNTDNTATGTFNLFTNDYIYYYEKGLRANKIGIPAGVYSTNPLPEKVEGFYQSTISKVLSLTALKAVNNVFNGVHYATTNTGVGFKDYLIHLDRLDLVNSINDQLDESKSKINLLNNNFQQQITSDNTKMTQTFDALQRAVILFKVDMLQAFNVNIDYVDGDGD